MKELILGIVYLISLIVLVYLSIMLTLNLIDLTEAATAWLQNDMLPRGN